ncbi:MAG: DUF2791 family P-loop domain-containing protein [Candidatus Obscuribacterales bacterium]|nr:DUF2791 family P-loop domain-containing protein [Candidatus Obscuribacterales bacterium]
MEANYKDRYLDALEVVAQNGIPGPGSSKLLDVGTTDYLDFFEQEFIESNAMQGNSVCRFFEGTFGAGKTHLIQLLSDCAEAKAFALVRLDLSTALNLADWNHITQHVLQNMTFANGEQKLKGLCSILEYLGDQDSSRIAKLRSMRLPQPGFANAMELALGMKHKSAEYKELLTRFLQGEKVSVTLLKRIGIKGVRGPLSVRNADQILKTTLNGLFHLGVPTMLLFDETERTLMKTNNPKYSKAANLMRRLVDAYASGGVHGSIVVFTVLPNFIQMCAEEYPALGQRLRTVPPDGIDFSWRNPVLAVRDLCPLTEEEFVDSAVGRMVQIADALGADEENLENTLSRLGHDILQNNAGAGFRRELMKALSNRVLKAARVHT